MRVLLASSLLALSVVATAPAAPIPKHLMPKEPAFAFPTKVGTTWVYEMGGKDKTLVISESEDAREGKRVTTEWVEPDGKRSPHMVRLVTTKGIFLVEEVGEKCEAPVCQMKSPHREGESWKTKASLGPTLSITVNRTAGPIERVKVPAGEFAAARVNCEFDPDFEAIPTVKASFWYADGIGLIQMGDDMKLKSFKLGKD